MIKMLFQLPNKIDLAFSGGIDSLVVAHFLARSKKDLRLWHFNHGCEYSQQIEEECRLRADQLNLPIVVDHLDAAKPPRQSQEDFWREHRYKFLRSSDRYMMTAHHLDDAVETWVWSSLHGEGKIIPYQNGNIIRPFLLTSKKDFEDYGQRHALTAVADPFNNDLHVMRNYLRANVMEHIEHINPGIDKVIRKKYLALPDLSLKPLATPLPLVQKLKM